MSAHKAMGAHHSARALTTTWLTPPPIITELGGWQSFRVDPCGFDNGEAFRTAQETICEPDDGLSVPWEGRAWVNPPYGSEAGAWLARLADHGDGTALIFARTETEMFQREVFGRASGLLWLAGRLHFHYPFGADPMRCFSGTPCEWVRREPDNPKNKAEWCPHCGMAGANAGAPSVLCAYGADEMDRLAACGLEGTFSPLRFARYALVEAMDLSWSQLVTEWVKSQDGPVSVSEAYRFFARHPKAQTNRHWKPKVRQKLQTHCRRVAPATYAAA